MKILRQYQIDIIFFFFALLIFIWLAFLGLKFFGVDPHRFEWLVAGPFIALYVAHLWQIRSRIQLSDRRQLTGKSLVYWIALGVIIFSDYCAPLPAAEYWSINLLFIIFSLLLADSYWDFKKLSIKNIWNKSETKK